MKEILLASNNPGKLREIASLLTDLGVRMLSPRDLGLNLTVAEVGGTYTENAALKARAFSRQAGMIALADDSGLEVRILGGEPGLHSARYAPDPEATDTDRRRYLLERLSPLPRPWLARFHCTVAIATPGEELEFTEGNCEGEIIPVERGTGGFGYDPIFYIPSMGKTMAELSLVEKNQVSHRARAVTAARPILRELLNRRE